MPNTLFLFDLDGVLVYPGGYKVALRATVDHFAAQMGQQPVGLTLDEIAEFEACGITNEWDSSAMCAAMMMVDVLLHRPELASDGIEGTLRAIRSDGTSIERPDFAGVAREVSTRTPHGVPPTETIDRMMRERAGGRFGAILDALLGDIYSLRTPTTRILQHFALGSERFRQTYGLEPEIDTESMLITHDTPLISQEMIEKLLERIEPGKPGMAIYTARPSLPPPDEPLEFEYKLHWYLDGARRPPAGYAAATRLSAVQKHPELTRFLVDFDGPYLNAQPADPAIEPVVTVGEGVTLVPDTVTIQKNPHNGTWRVTFALRPDGSGRAVELRCFLRKTPHVLTETWSYLWNP